MNDIKMVSYNDLSQYLNDAENKSKKDISFLLTNKITLCVNNEDSIENEIKKNDDFFVLENNDKILYIDSILINNLIKSIESAINKYIKKNDSNLNKIKKFSLDEDVKKIISLNSDNVEIKSVHQVEDVITILNKLYCHKSSSELLENLSSIEEVKLILSKKHNLVTKLVKSNHKIFAIKKIDDIIKTISNSTNIFPLGILPLDKKISLFNLKNKKNFHDEFNKEEPQELSKKDRINDNNKIQEKDKRLFEILKCIEENKNKIKAQISFYENFCKVFNESNGYFYYANIFNYKHKYSEVINKIKTINNSLIRDYYKESEVTNKNKENEKNIIAKKYYIPEWNLAQEEYNDINMLNNGKIKDDDSKELSYDYLFAMNTRLKQNISLIEENISKMEKENKTLLSLNEKIKSDISGMEGNNNITLLIKDKNIIKKNLNKLSDIISGKIKYRKESFLSSIYKFFFPKRHSEIINKLTENKNIIDDVISYLNLSDKYLSNTLPFRLGLMKEKHVRVVNDDFFIKSAVNMISTLSLSTDFFDYINNRNDRSKDILDSIFYSNES
ncbi:hypothetical protein [Proteus faecis]|uniref:hypothetical protein n=1 Tax=Proteus faecis TaxID=2050967 RepID=UPI000D69199D|nr:hypothetical protein [Proteus faecis]